MTQADRYLTLLKRALTRYGEDDWAPLSRKSGLVGAVAKAIKGAARGKAELCRHIPFDAWVQDNGRSAPGAPWPHRAETMIGMKRLDNIQLCVETVIREEVPGDLVETGVWRGGGSIFMRGALEAYGDGSRIVWCADSFEGLPVPNIKDYPQDAGVQWHTAPELAVSVEAVKANFAKYDLLDDRVKFLVGWFKDTLASAPIGQIAVLRLDGDMYESTMDALKPLYGKLSSGGFLIIDDYGLPEDSCRRAIHDFRDANGIDEPIIDIDGWGAYWRKR